MSSKITEPAPVEGEDYYFEGAFIVFTERYHLRRGYCCESGCRHCPYGVTPDEEKAARGRAGSEPGGDGDSCA
jgi:hypothetical protein